MSKNILDEILAREIQRTKTPSVKDAVAMLIGKDERSIPKPMKKNTAKKKVKRKTVDDVVPEKTGTIEQIPKIDHISEIPDGFPEGTVLNDDATLTLADGRTIQKIPEVSDVEA